jgi:hypothetical protein
MKVRRELPLEVIGGVFCFCLFKRVLHLSAIERMVRAYVELRNRKELENMKAHRHRLVTDLKSRKGAVDLSSQIRLLEDDIAVIDAGLAKLDSGTAA